MGMPDKATSIDYVLTKVASDAVSLNDEELGLSHPPIGNDGSSPSGIA